MEMRYQGHNFATSPAGNLFVNVKFSDVSARCGASIPLGRYHVSYRCYGPGRSTTVGKLPDAVVSARQA